MNKKNIKLFNIVSFILCTFSVVIVILGRHVKHFCTYNDTDIFIQAITLPGTNLDVLVGCIPSILIGLALGLFFSSAIFALSRLFPNKFPLDSPKNATSLLGFSVLFFCLCINHMGLELQFVFKNL